jgi:VWFA-related protein
MFRRMNRRRFLHSTAAFGAACLFPALAQDASFSADVKVVNLFATVRDKDNNIIRNLTKDDFSLTEDNRLQSIRYFSQETDLPLTLGVLVDTSKSQSGVLEEERTASYAFLQEMLRPDKDLAFVVSFDVRVKMLAKPTSSVQALRAAFDALKIPIFGSTLLYTAVKRASEDTMRKEKGRKAFIILSDGVDVHSMTSLGTAIEYAQRADTAIYSILFADRQNNGFYSRRGRKALQRLSLETGGSFFEVTGNQTIEKIYARIQEELRSQYSLGYTSDAADARAYRRIGLTTKQKEFTVRTSDGYYPAGKE